MLAFFPIKGFWPYGMVNFNTKSKKKWLNDCLTSLLSLNIDQELSASIESCLLQEQIPFPDRIFYIVG